MAAYHTSFMFECKYNISQASHMNGVAESLIRSCRRAFDAASNYRTRAYTRNEWETIVAEANYLLNSRPLFPKSVDDLDQGFSTLFTPWQISKVKFTPKYFFIFPLLQIPIVIGKNLNFWLTKFTPKTGQIHPQGVNLPPVKNP